jgi:hypothetical protein
MKELFSAEPDPVAVLSTVQTFPKFKESANRSSGYQGGTDNQVIKSNYVSHIPDTPTNSGYKQHMEL